MMARARSAPVAARITKRGYYFLCALEVLAHSAMLPANMMVVKARIPNSLFIQTVEESDLPPNWSDSIPSKENARPRNGLGKEWGYHGALCALRYRSQTSLRQPNRVFASYAFSQVLTFNPSCLLSGNLG
jgi:hypothetical protein